MVLQGAEILFYPTAIGSEPQDDGLDSREHWKRVMQGHSGANLVIQLKLQSKHLTELTGCIMLLISAISIFSSHCRFQSLFLIASEKRQ